MVSLKNFLIQSVPEDLDTKLLLAGLGNMPFLAYHDLFTGSTTIVSENETLPERFSNIGVSVKEIDMGIEFGSELIYLQIMAKEKQRSYDPDKKENEINEIYQLFKFKTKAISTFYPTTQPYINTMKDDIEGKISRMDVRATKSMPADMVSSNRDSVHNDLYYGSGQKKLLLSILENVNESMISRGVSYKVGMVIEKTEHSEAIISYMKSKTVVLKASTIKAKNINELHGALKKLDGVPLPYTNASRLLWLSGKTRQAAPLITFRPRTSGEIGIGSYLDSALVDTKEQVGIERCIFNLGTLITGVPGTGKTMVTKHILSQFPSKENRSMVIISPTAEWNGFCSELGIRTIDMSDPAIRMNFFKCEGSSPQKFYEDLALLIASASNAGPYRNAIEKCLLAAFSKVYSRSQDPDPQDVYSEVEEAIIDQHGKRTQNSVKYTKHGENIKSSLENLRLMLMKPQFAYCGGISFRELVKGGAVFDLSNVSNSMKPIFYAFILNQVYCITDEFDTNGDGELRSVICVEEAHLIFGGEEESAATIDLRQRIQNFRKKGIGLFLITHNVTDINPGIRRLCQVKIYFRQSPDIAKYAANDMIFSEDDYIRAAGMFKTLGQRICALSYIEIVNKEKVPVNSMLVIVPGYVQAPAPAQEKEATAPNKETIISLEGWNGKECRIELHYLSEKILSDEIKAGSITIPNLLEEKRYKLIILGEKRRDNKEFTIIAGSENTITLQTEAKNAGVA